MADQPADDPELPLPGTRLEGLALGIDVGGTGVKAALVNLATAELISIRARERTPQPSHPDAVTRGDRQRGGRHGARRRSCPPTSPAGCGLPGVVELPPADDRRQHRSGVGRLAGRGEDQRRRSAVPTMIINDADAAGLAEMAFGAGRGERGTVLMLTLGTGHRQRPVHRRRAGAEHRVRPPRVPRQGRRGAAQRRVARAAPASAGRRGRASSTRTWRASSSTSQPDLFILGGGVSQGMGTLGQVPDARDAASGRRSSSTCRDHRRGVRGRRGSRARPAAPDRGPERSAPADAGMPAARRS